MSRHLKEHLKSKGILSHAVGLHFKNLATVEKIKHAQTIICVHPEIKKAVEDQFDVSDKKVICLKVTDTPDTSEAAKRLTGELWSAYQQDYVYPELERQIKKHLRALA